MEAMRQIAGALTRTHSDPGKLIESADLWLKKRKVYGGRPEKQDILADIEDALANPYEMAPPSRLSDLPRDEKEQMVVRGKISLDAGDIFRARFPSRRNLTTSWRDA